MAARAPIAWRCSCFAGTIRGPAAKVPFAPAISMCPAPTLFPKIALPIKNQGETNACTGFALSAVAGWAVGVALDAAGGNESPAAWLAGFAVLAAGILMGPIALWWSRRSTEPRPEA